MAGDGASHEEIWDDSALLNSWDDALAEYKVCNASLRDNAYHQTDQSKKYHSLAAKGETVDLSTLEEDQQANTAIDIQQSQPSNEAVNATVEGAQTIASATPTTQPAVAVPVAPVAADSVRASTTQPSAGAGAMPQALLNSGKHGLHHV